MKKILSLLLLFISIQLTAQNQAANWFFGYGAGLKFDLGANTLTSVNGGSLFTNEGCASISDAFGDLLFYTDGTIVWDKNNNVMTNGTGLYGDSSSTQSAIIVPKPNDPDLYYVFTVDNALDGFNFGLNYSLIDMKLNGGLGNVVTKNSNLLPSCSEKISAVLKDCITKSIWVITFTSQNGYGNNYNTFYAYEVSDTGINNAPVVSTFPSISTSEARGYLKLSPDGQKLACANVGSGLFLFDFDVSTGIVSNQKQLFIDTPSSSAYGIEFSPSSQLFYVHSSNDSQSNSTSDHYSTLSQFDLNSTNISNSGIVIDQRQLYRGGLQLGPDGKIYRALSATYTVGLPFLGVINNPNAFGTACNYQHNAVSLSPNNSSQGLPPFIQSIFNAQVDIIRNNVNNINLALCMGDSYTLTSEDIPGADYTWTVDGILLPETDFDLIVTQGGHYQVYINLNNGDCNLEGQAFVSFSENPVANDTTLIQCDDDGVSDGYTLFNINQANDEITAGESNRNVTYFLSTTDALKNVNEIDSNAFNNTSNPQVVIARVVNSITGCSSLSSVTLQSSNTSSVNAALERCDDDGTEDGLFNFNLMDVNPIILKSLPSNLNIVYYENYNDALLETNPLGASYTNIVPYSQLVYARVENSNACYGISEVQLTILKLPNIETAIETIYCLNKFPETITIDSGVIGGSINNFAYEWSTGESTYEIKVNAPGSYSVRITNNNGCYQDRIVNVLPSNIAIIDNIEIIDASQDNIATVFVSGEGDYEYAIDDILGPYQDQTRFDNVAAGLHTIYVRDKNNCGISEELISVIGFPKFFTPNNDNTHDYWQVHGITVQFQPMTTIFIYDRFGTLIKELDPLSKGWDGTFNGRKLPTSDYWFYVTLEDGRIFKSHFTLKR